MKKIISLLFAGLVGFSTFAAPTVTEVVAKQRYPWNGLVDITCKVSGIDETTKGFEFLAMAIVPDFVITNRLSHIWVMKDGVKSTDKTVKGNGNYRLLWDAKAELGEVRYTNMIMSVTLNRKQREKVQLWKDGPYWATTNIGADEPWESGYYFWWGDTVGYKRENDKWVASDGSKSNFSFYNNAPTSNIRSIETLQSEGWITADGVLASEHDAAHVQWGGEWRMPTYQELNDLCYNKCDWTWTSMNGVSGYAVCGRGDYALARIFLPCVGKGYKTELLSFDSVGDYWSSEPKSSSTSAVSFFLSITSRECTTAAQGYRSYGHSIRPVQ